MTYKQQLTSLQKQFPSIKIANSIEGAAFVSAANLCEHHQIPLRKDVLQFVVETANELRPQNENDYYFLTTMAFLDSGNLYKVAYPNIESATIVPEYDLDKWVTLVYKIYSAAKNGKMDYDKAVDHYASSLDKDSGEDQKFKQWLKYYKNGDHLKYSNIVHENGMKKVAYQFGLNSPGFYPKQDQPIPSELILDQDSKENFSTWKQKLYQAIRRLDKLIRQGDDLLDPDLQAELADLLHRFDMEVRKTRLNSTASDITLKYSNLLEERGFAKEAGEFVKLAQAAPSDPFEEPEERPAAPAVKPPSAPMRPDAPNPLGPTDELSEPKPSGSTVGNALKNTEGPEEGEYEALDGDITVEHASSKLEEVAGRLADRRVIRLLAEFDIMLDKLGVAAMFPELLEAESKLIDAYSYALTRVTKMLGMLSSGRDISDIVKTREAEITNDVQKEVNKSFNAPNETEQLKSQQPEVKPQEKKEQGLDAEFGAPKTPEVKTEPSPDVPITPQPEVTE